MNMVPDPTTGPSSCADLQAKGYILKGSILFVLITKESIEFTVILIKQTKISTMNFKN